jgi:hypothetical protein
MEQRIVCGSCTCRRVRFEAELPTRFVAHCHCENCRRSHGAAFVTWAGFPGGHFRWTEGEDTVARFVTDTGATRSSCGVCGTPLTFESPRWEGEVHVAVACVDDPLDRAPSGHVYADRAPDWCPISDDLPRYGGPDGVTPLE